MNGDPSAKKPARLLHPTEYEIVARKRVLDAFFKVDEVTVSHQQYDGEMSKARPWLIYERGDAAAALLFDSEEREVILVEQFRIPTIRSGDGGPPALGKGSGEGWLLETVAGIIKEAADGKPKETPEQCIIREIREEVGYQVTDLVPVATFFSSPGGSSERIFLYLAEVRRSQQVDAGGGVDDGEDIRVVTMPLGEFTRKLDAREFSDPKLIIAGQWLRDRRQAQKAEGRPIEEPQLFALQKAPSKAVGYVVGDIENIKDIDVWVNSENTDMMMDRFFDRSISAKIRYLGAKKFPRSGNVDQDTIADALAKGVSAQLAAQPSEATPITSLRPGDENVAEDTIGNDLHSHMHNRKFIRPGCVIDTTSGELQRSHGVKRIFHVATVAGYLGQGVRTNMSTLEDCIDEVLEAVDTRGRYKSVLFPMIGTGGGGFQVRDVAPRLIERAVKFLERGAPTRIERILFLGYSAGDGDTLADIFQRMSEPGKSGSRLKRSGE